MNKLATLAFRPRIGDAGYPSLARRVSTGLPFGIAVIVLAVALGVAGAAHAENECGEPEAGTPVVCSPSNYDAATDGNIVYFPSGTDEGDFTIRLTDDLSIRYDRDNPDDDQLVFPGEEDPLYSAVRIETGPDHAGDVSLFSSADVTSNARGISVGYYGKSGAMRTEIAGGTFSIASDWQRAFAIHSYRGDEFDTNDDFSGDHDLIVRNVVVDLEGGRVGVLGSQGVEGDLNVSVQDSDIKVDADRATGVYGAHDDTGNVNVEVQDSDIEVRGSGGIEGIYGSHRGTGDTDINVRDVDIEVHGADSRWAQIGILGYRSGEGYLNVAVQDTAINVDAELAVGLFGAHRGTGDVGIEVQDVDIKVRGPSFVDGIYGFHLGAGDTDITVRNVDIEAHGERNSNGIGYSYWRSDGTGNLSIDARDVDIAVHGETFLDGIFGMHRGTGDIDVDVRSGTIVTTGTDSGGIAFVHDGDGGIDIAARDLDIEVNGDRSVGIGGGQRYEGTGDIAIDVRDSTLAVTGESVAGIRSFNFTGQGSISVRVDGGTITAEGKDSSGILVGLTGRIFGRRTGPIKAPAGEDVEVDGDEPGDGSAAEGYRPQDVFVNGRVRGGTGVGAGVRLYGGGRVEIGPRGSVGADSGVAVRAEGDGAALHVVARLDGRRPSDAIVGEIRNDDGRTTVAINGVVLHDGMTGATGRLAPNGARDVSLMSSETVAGRVFMPTDFVTSYAPRAAVYEALPGFMVRLDSRGTAGKQLRSPGTPAWIRVSGSRGSYGPEQASVEAAYDFGRFEAEAGLEAALSREGNVTGSVSLRHVRGSADVSAPTGGGKIEAAGFGASFGASWENAAGYFASGRFSVTRYETDTRADGRGLLKEGASATVHTFGVEAGRRFTLADDLSLTPLAWLTRSDVSMDDFQDAVGSRVSLRESARSIVGLGVVTETAHSWDGGERTLDLCARLGVEQVLGDAETVADVSGERLGSEAGRTRAVLGLGAAYRWNGWTWGGEISASGLGSNESAYTVSLRLRTQF